MIALKLGFVTTKYENVKNNSSDILQLDQNFAPMNEKGPSVGHQF